MIFTKSSSNSCTLEDSKRNLSGMAYALRRLIDFEASWVAYLPSFEDKSILGFSLSHDAQSISALSTRLEEQLTVDPEYISSSVECCAYFDDFSNKTDQNEIKGFIHSTTRAIKERAEMLKEKVDPLYDIPSLHALRTVSDCLGDKLELLSMNDWPLDVNHPNLDIDENSNIKWNEGSLRPALRDDPAHPSFLRRSDEKVWNATTDVLLSSKEGVQRFLHYIYADIEVLAVEVCARNIAEYGPYLPLQFSVDMARQCSDEARHAVMMAEAMEKYDVALGDFPYANRVWLSYMKGETLAEKIAIEQLISEGNGIDNSEIAIELMKHKDLSDLAKMYRFVQADETVHCSFGNRWLNYIVDNDPENYEAAIDSSIAKTGMSVPGKYPVNVTGRLASKYPEWFIEKRLIFKPLNENAEKQGGQSPKLS